MEGKLFGRFQLMGWLFAVGMGGSFPLHRRGWRVIGLCRVAGGWKGFLAPVEEGGKRGSQRRGGAVDETTRFAVFLSQSGGTF